MPEHMSRWHFQACRRTVVPPIDVRQNRDSNIDAAYTDPCPGIPPARLPRGFRNVLCVDRFARTSACKFLGYTTIDRALTLSTKP